jgi:spore coat polysaccharide biosynthesis predicted glycosyltransferase SpsG
MRYIFRADSSRAIGSGHVMRSSAIAEDLIARGREAIFIGAISDVPWVASRIMSLGFSQILESSEAFVSDPGNDVLIIDSYTVSIGDEFIQQKHWRRIVAISDDLTPKYKADLIIHPGISDEWKPNRDVKFLTGPKYIPFRKSIKKKVKNLSIKETLKILVVGGGTDPFNFADEICLVLKNIQGQFHVIIFSNNNLLAQTDPRFTVVQIGFQLDLEASDADLVFTTASTTSLEFIAREIPVGLGCAVDNQQEYYESLVGAKIAMPVGEFSEGRWKLDHAKMAELINSGELRKTLEQKSAGLLDLKGAERIVDEILKL